MNIQALQQRVARLEERGVIVVDPRQTYIDPSVDLGRVCSGATLHPGTRLVGGRTFVGPGASVGAEGPAVLVDAVVGPQASVASGYVEGAVLLSGAKVGANAHLRPGTVLEESASTAHCVGLKQTVLLSFVTLGSLINFCDILMAGGTSSSDHSEVGSGFIHFNFTPWGQRGDKATASLIGDVTQGVFLRSRRIFLGGSSGLVGPGKVGYGAITAAGQVVRKSVPEQTLWARPTRALDRDLPDGYLDAAQPRTKRNLEYIGQLQALIAWYEQVRLARIPDDDGVEPLRVVTTAALENLRTCRKERIKRLNAFLTERGQKTPQLPVLRERPCPLELDATGPYVDHVPWVQGLGTSDVEAGTGWLEAIARDQSDG